MPSDPVDRKPRRRARKAPSAKPKKKSAESSVRRNGEAATIQDFAHEAEAFLTSPPVEPKASEPARPDRAPQVEPAAPAAKQMASPAPADPPPPDLGALSRNVARYLDETGKLA